MPSHQGIIDALTAFYEAVIKHLSLDDSALQHPPAQGWNIDVAAPGLDGKTDQVIELLQHTPYLSLGVGEYQIRIQVETAALDYTKGCGCSIEEINPLPANCVYLTEGISPDGYSLIVDVDTGMVTTYSVSGRDTRASVAELSQLPASEQWRGDRKLPAIELLSIWTRMYARLVIMLVPNPPGHEATGAIRSRALSREHGEELAQEVGPFQEWYPSDVELSRCAGGGKDDVSRQLSEDQLRHTAAVFNAFLRHGWAENFDKVSGKLEVVELEKQIRVKEKKALAMMESGAGPSDHVEEDGLLRAHLRAQVDKLWEPKESRMRKKTGGAIHS
ncbi:hypothetical protein TI39_contig337g00011 [Zymoseptoria brevis]|uniref:Uncharacterized protein n=1 Tax=Zymoseptoria brevis TaxID=1047168 RepID=A0A0F4GVN0_9PEZI|nr:hypothetical protein TI39_contig337g00011 [Zymoseptoria brevis]